MVILYFNDSRYLQAEIKPKGFWASYNLIYLVMSYNSMNIIIISLRFFSICDRNAVCFIPVTRYPYPYINSIDQTIESPLPSPTTRFHNSVVPPQPQIFFVALCRRASLPPQHSPTKNLYLHIQSFFKFHQYDSPDRYTKCSTIDWCSYFHSKVNSIGIKLPRCWSYSLSPLFAAKSCGVVYLTPFVSQLPAQRNLI